MSSGDGDEPSGDGADGRAADGPARSPGTARAAGSPEFDWRGWALVGAILVAFFLVPLAVLYLPAAQEFIRSLGLTMRDGYLVLPLLPAFGLGALAVWSAVRSQSS